MPRPSAATFFACAIVAVPASGISWSEKCLEDCNGLRNHIYQEHLDTACENYRYVMPRPKQVYRYCKGGFDEALHEQCPKLCTDKGSHSHATDRAHDVCKWTKDMTPRPVSYEACTKGYHAGYLNAKAFGEHIKANHDGSATEQVLADAAAEEKAAAAEADKVAAARSAQIKAAAAKAAEAAAKDEIKKVAQESAKEKAKPASADELKKARAAARQAYAAEQARKASKGAKADGVDV